MTSSASTSFSVVFPGYNEESNIRHSVEGALEALRPLFKEFEIIVVNDASRDRTGEIADELAKQHPEVRVIHNSRNLGQGASIVVGFESARCDLLMHNAMDSPFDLRDLVKLLPLLDEADVIVASRRSRPGYSLYRRLASWVHRALLHVLFRPRLRDYNFVQLYRKSVWKSIAVEARSTAFLTPEMLIRAFDAGWRIREVEIEYHPRLHGEATSGKPRVVLASVRDMLRFWWKRRRGYSVQR